MANDVEYFLKCLLDICITSFVNCLSLLPFLYWFIFYYWVGGDFHVVKIQVLCPAHVLNIFSQSTCLPIFIMVSVYCTFFNIMKILKQSWEMFIVNTWTPTNQSPLPTFYFIFPITNYPSYCMHFKVNCRYLFTSPKHFKIHINN